MHFSRLNLLLLAQDTDQHPHRHIAVGLGGSEMFLQMWIFSTDGTLHDITSEPQHHHHHHHHHHHKLKQMK
ncbi:conserved hypothetical protein [Ricinus communis]|uniref:Uncharacterized protein n=1 Tax=Ricinus communis TaxID=3988 RepID=B9RZD2_RICCO|nr:conserved hypothetical protein [Ricinus communis]